MIDESFLFCKGIGGITEKKLQLYGIKNWQIFLEQFDTLPLSKKKKENLKPQILKCLHAVQNNDIKHLTQSFPTKDHWRLLKNYQDRLSFFDIETTGLSMNSSYVTVIACLHKGEMHRFIAGKNLDDFVDLLEDIDILVSFNGSSFDVPRILNEFSIPELDCAHLDLRWICYHQGLKGNLKFIEQQLGVHRNEDLMGMSGMDAVVLWDKWKKAGDQKALDKLIYYCCADVLALEKISHMICNHSPYTGQLNSKMTRVGEFTII